MGSGKPRGLAAARKLLKKKAHCPPTSRKADPFEGASHAKGVVIEKCGIEARQPNWALRKVVKVRLLKNGRNVFASVPRDGCLNYLDLDDKVLLAGRGRKGKSVGDLPGVHYKVITVAGVSLEKLYRQR